jgi:hypothetical protein
MTAAAHPDDGAVLQRWWNEFASTGRLPNDLEPVQARLVRAVHRGELPSGPVYVKVMTFPRAKDRLRYLLRALPGAHEARMLRATAAAGIVCPEVVFVRTARRFGLPHRSMLVLRALAVRSPALDPAARLLGEAAVAARLLAAGIVHRDLHGENFVELQDGRLAVLDLQSAAMVRRPPGAAARIRAAARLLQGRRPRRQAWSARSCCARPTRPRARWRLRGGPVAGSCARASAGASGRARSSPGP